MVCTKLFIFDFDGTLFDSRSAIVHCLHRTCEHFGAPKPSDAMTQQILASGLTLADAIQSLILQRATDTSRTHSAGADAGIDPTWIDVYRDFYAREGGALTLPYPGAQAALANTAAAGFEVAVVSNKGESAIHKALAEHGMTSDVALVVGDLPGVPKKPHPAAFDQVVRVRLQVAPDAHLVMLGDTPADLHFARNIGARAWWAKYGYGDAATCLAVPPDRIVESLDEVLHKTSPDR